MTLPSAAPPRIEHTCPRCGDYRSAPVGDRLHPCSCKDLPPSEREQIAVYQRVSGIGPNYYAIALPLDQRPVKAFGDSADEVIGRVKTLLDAGWKA